MPEHRVTIGLYSVQKDSKFHPAALGQVDNILKIRDKLSEAARHRGEDPPEIVLSVLLIPDWANGRSYEDPEYLRVKEEFLQAMRERLDAAGLGEIKLENFYDIAYPEEKAYLEQLRANGSNADMIKTHALISDENAQRRHLQLDSNTIIHDYDGLYGATFGRSDSFGVNASYYDLDYVSIHNKIVYAPPNTEFVEQLRGVHLEYCDAHKNDHRSEATVKEKTLKNSIYARDFAVAAHRSRLTTMVSIPQTNGDLRTIYPANMARPEYGLSRFIVTAVNMSWSASRSDQPEALSRLPSVQVGDAGCDAACFRMAIKKHTGRLNNHKYGGHPEQLRHDMNIPDPATRTQALLEDEAAHNELLACSNTVVDKVIISKFYDSAMSFVSGDSGASAVMGILAHEFPNNKRGNALNKIEIK